MSTEPSRFRSLCKTESHTTHTSGYCPGFAQANLLVLPKTASDDFVDLCKRNPVACPLIGVTDPGDPFQIDDKRVIFDPGFDVRTDFPKYTVYEDGKLIATKTNIKDEWTDEHVAFLIGCSFSFESALQEAGLSPAHFKESKNVSMYLTTKMMDASGIFVRCPYVVSMRPYKPEMLQRVREITREFRKTHGEPIDWGYDALDRLGIKDINKPDFGDACEIADNEIPVFWACGVTPQIAAVQASSSIKGKVMAHLPGHMLVLDIKDADVKHL
ncbi:hypothetical protein KL936_004552 [Ogataea polymorpha]|nr:hypothetical protein KL936_004552 [Ogataea polymorpha]